jgi:hypothetical protein
MLIDKDISTGDVVTLKLNNGEELLGRFVEETSHGVKISKPMALSMSQQGIGLIPFLFTVNPDKDITVNHSCIVVQASTDKAFADQYIQSTTGIKLA